MRSGLSLSIRKAGCSLLLTSLWAAEFKEDGQQRPPIQFHAGLNTIQGTDRGKNSIGKSTVLYLIDWALGGNRFAETKTVTLSTAVGHHVVYFTYEFEGLTHYFTRATDSPEFIDEYADDTYTLSLGRRSRDDFTDWLKQKYGLGESETSFRNLQGRFLRVQESASAATAHPLAAAPKEPELNGIVALEDLFGLYKGLVEASKAHKEADDNYKALARTQNQQLLKGANIRTAKAADEARTQIAATESQLRALRNRTDNTLSIDDQERSSEVAHLKAQLQELRIRRGQHQAQAKIAEQSLRGTRPIGQEDLDELITYFPEVNVARLREVESFHRELTDALRDEYQRQLDADTDAVSELDQQIAYTEDHIRALGKPVDVPDETWDEYGKLSARHKALEIQLEIWDAKEALLAERRRLQDALTQLRRSALLDVRQAMNSKLSELNDLVTPDQQPPVLSFNEKGTTYKFESPDDEGSGVADKDLSLFDLAVFDLTPLPVIIHDSVLFNNVEKDVVGRILELYKQSTKQVFIAFDREKDYAGTPVEEIVQATSVITLGADTKALYGWQWNKKADEREVDEQ